MEQLVLVSVGEYATRAEDLVGAALPAEATDFTSLRDLMRALSTDANAFTISLLWQQYIKLSICDEDRVLDDSPVYLDIYRLQLLKIVHSISQFSQQMLAPLFSQESDDALVLLLARIILNVVCCTIGKLHFEFE